MAVDPALSRLTYEQLVAAAAGDGAVFLEAAPGSGKTTVAAYRFGALRYARRTDENGDHDPRAVLAVSFTRSATRELLQRVRRVWGPTAATWPHRICTIDTVVKDLVHDLIKAGAITWPDAVTELDVRDSWKGLVKHGWLKRRWGAALGPGGVVITQVVERFDESKACPNPTEMQALVRTGVCTHDDVRQVLDDTLRSVPGAADRVCERLRQTIAALIVDEVYDANLLDLGIVRLARLSGATVTIVGDPWQALYGWRGATPDRVPQLVSLMGMRTLPLTKSFRWDTDEQAALATALRTGAPVLLPQSDPEGLEVVLAHKWRALWGAGDNVLPLAFKSTPGTVTESACTLLLHTAVVNLLRQKAAFVDEALLGLGIDDPQAMDRMSPGLASLLEGLAGAQTRADCMSACAALVTLVQSESPRTFPRIHSVHVDRLEDLSRRLRSAGSLIPGLTVHQAKGQEWTKVGVILTESERAALARGLDPTVEDDRRVYVACTRARTSTTEVRSTTASSRGEAAG